MQSALNGIRELAQTGIKALQSNDPAAAIYCFEKIIDTGAADASIYLALAHAYRAVQNEGKSRQAIDHLLALEPTHLRGLMFKAEILLIDTNEKEALSLFRLIIKIAAESTHISPDMQDELNYVYQKYTELSQKFERVIIESIGGESVIQRPEAARFKQSLELLLGKKQIYFQNPRLYYFPELPQIYFFSHEKFSWIKELEAATADIRSELEAILNDDLAFQPYVQVEKNQVITNPSPMLNNPEWGAYYLWKNGIEIKEHTLQFPKTKQALSRIPSVLIPNRAPTILFSLLKPGAKIPPHTGVLNTRLICHLPIIVPPGCGLRVGSEIREWEEGKVWIFDDTIEHEAWNQSNEVRIILIFEIWRPELTIEEKGLVSKLMQSINEYQDGAENISNV